MKLNGTLCLLEARAEGSKVECATSGAKTRRLEEDDCTAAAMTRVVVVAVVMRRASMGVGSCSDFSTSQELIGESRQMFSPYHLLHRRKHTQFPARVPLLSRPESQHHTVANTGDFGTGSSRRQADRGVICEG